MPHTCRAVFPAVCYRIGETVSQNPRSMWKRQADFATRLTLRGYLVMLTLAIILPVLVFAAILYYRYYEAVQSRVDADLINDARQTALTVDRDLAGLLNILQTLTTSTR